MTTSEPGAGRRAGRDDGRRGGGAVPADDLAVAGLSGRRVLLFQRHRMGGGGRRHHGRRLACATGWPRCSPKAPAFATACFWRRRIAPRRAQTTPVCARSPNWRPPSCPRANASSRPRRRAAPSSTSRASAWTCDGLDEMIAACDGPIVYPVAVGLVSAAHAIPLAPAMHAFLHAVVSNWISAGARLVPLGQTDSQRVLASLEAGRRRHREARACSIARRSRQRHLSRRSRQPAPRDAVYAAVPVMMRTHSHPSSRRTPGPITTRVVVVAKASAIAASIVRSRVYGSLRSQGRR